MENNKGFTLVELIICLAIFGIIIASVFGFVLTGTKSYTYVNGIIDLQMHTQITMNFIGEYLIDCDEAVYYDGTDTLYILNKSEIEDSAYAYIFKFDSTNKSIYFSQASADRKDDGSFSCSAGEEEPELLSDMAERFSVTLNRIGSGGSQSVTSVDVEISFKNYSSEIDCSKTIALRNKPTSAKGITIE